MATNIMGTTMTAVSLEVLRPCCRAGIRVGVLVACDAWIGVEPVLGLKVVWEAELIGAGSVVMLPALAPCGLLTDFAVPLTVESVTLLDAAETTALLGFPLTGMSGSRIGDVPVGSPLLFAERR